MYIVLYLLLILTSFICITQLSKPGNWYSPVNWSFYNPWLKVESYFASSCHSLLNVLLLGALAQCSLIFHNFDVFEQSTKYLTINVTPYGFVWFLSLKFRLCIRLLQKRYSFLNSSLKITYCWCTLWLAMLLWLRSVT